MHLIYKNNCRICSNSALKPTLDLGEHFLHGSFVNPAKNVYPPTRKIPVELVRCDTTINNGCGLLQLKHTVHPSILYSHYGYRSSTSKTMTNWLKSIVDSIIKLNPEVKSVLDIGANDLFTLRQFPRDIKRVGIDGCDIITQVDSDGIEVIHGMYPMSVPRKHLRSREPFDVITSIACLYDIENINEFVSSITYELSNHGMWVFEVAYLPTILERTDYTHFVHEHLLTFSLATIENLLNRHGLKLFRAVKTETNGGSILCYACHKFCNIYNNTRDQEELQDLRLYEFNMKLDADEPYNEFRVKISRHTEDLHELISKLVYDENKTIHLLSSSTKGNLLLQCARINNSLIKYASERSQEKVGCKTLGTNIEIISEEESRKMKPDYYLCLVGHFQKEILEREKEFIQNGGKIIFPFPTISVYP